MSTQHSDSCAPYANSIFPAPQSFSDPMLPLCSTSCLQTRAKLVSLFPDFMRCECNVAAVLAGSTLEQRTCDSVMKILLQSCRDVCVTQDSSRCDCSDTTMDCDRMQTIPNIALFPTRAFLTNITLRDGLIAFLPPYSFVQFPLLASLDLSNNILTEVPPVFAGGSTQLRRVVLDGNRISKVYDGSFGPLTAVTYL